MTNAEINALRFELPPGESDAGTRRRPTPDFDPEWRVLELPRPPSNTDPSVFDHVVTMREDHRRLTDLEILRIRWEDRVDVETVFVKALEEMGMKVPKTVRVEAEKLVEQLSTIGLHLKDRYGRIRPNAWLRATGRTFRFPEAQTGHSPSYPSNHALIGAFMGDWFGQRFPRARQAMDVLGKQVGWNRVLAGFNFPDDFGMGRVVGRKLWTLYRGNTK